MWCQNQNFWDHHVCLVGKYKPFGQKKLLPSLKKKNPEPFHARFEYAMGNPFFSSFLNKDWNTPNFFLKSNYIVLYEKNVFRFNFGPQEVPQPENAWKWKCIFSGWGTLPNMKAFFS